MLTQIMFYSAFHAQAEEDGGKDDGDMGDTKSESSEPGHDELGAAGTLLNGEGRAAPFHVMCQQCNVCDLILCDQTD